MKKYTAKEFFKIMLGHFVAGITVTAVFYLLSKNFGSICPTYRLFHVCCPFCGMTRAHLAALRLDFASAIYYNPVFFLAIPTLFLLIHDRIAPKYDKIRKILAALLLSVIFAAYIVRVFLYGFDFF